jgi:hypothetical protein
VCTYRKYNTNQGSGGENMRTGTTIKMKRRYKNHDREVKAKGQNRRKTKMKIKQMGLVTDKLWSRKVQYQKS